MKTEKDFICIAGTDGSGKTTQSSLLLENIENSATYSWCKFESQLLAIAVSTIKLLYSKTGEDMGDYETRSQKKSSILSNPIIKSLYLSYVLIHYYTQVLRSIVVPLSGGKTVVCDRYVYDTIVDLAVDLDLSKSTYMSLLTAYSKLIPTPDVVIYIEVSPDISLQRKDDIPNREFVEEKKAVYDEIFQCLDSETIDGSRNIEEVQSEIQRIVN